MGWQTRQNGKSERRMKDLPPQSRILDNWPLCFVEFRVRDQERFQILSHAFELFKQEKLKLLAAISDDDDDDREMENDVHQQALRKLADALFDLFDEQVLA